MGLPIGTWTLLDAQITYDWGGSSASLRMQDGDGNIIQRYVMPVIDSLLILFLVQSDDDSAAKDADIEIQRLSDNNGVVSVGMKVKKAVSPKKYRTFAFLICARF